MSGGAAAAAEADIAGTMTRGDRCRRMLQEGSSIDIAAVISGHIAAAPNVSSRRGRAFPRAAASSADYRGKRRLLQYLVLKLRALARGETLAPFRGCQDKTKLPEHSGRYNLVDTTVWGTNNWISPKSRRRHHTRTKLPPLVDALIDAR